MIYTNKKMMRTQSRQRFQELDLEDRNDIVTSQGMLAATRNWKRQGMESPLEPLRDYGLNFGLLAFRTVRE